MPTAPATGLAAADLPLAAVVPVPWLVVSLLSPLAAALVVLLAKGSGVVAEGAVARTGATSSTRRSRSLVLPTAMASEPPEAPAMAAGRFTQVTFRSSGLGVALPRGQKKTAPRSTCRPTLMARPRVQSSSPRWARLRR